jgi:hypothetical protein
VPRSPNLHSGPIRVLSACAFVSLLLALLALADPAEAASRTKVGDFASPIHVTAPEGDTRRVFVVQRGGRIKLLLDGEERNESFLNINDIVGTAGEGGLLSMAFAPDYATSRKFYVFYTTPGGNIRVDEFERSESSPNLADPESGRHVIRIRHPNFTNHYGGQIQFGPDDSLYVSTGDGGGTPEKAQDPDSLLGKVLRIDPLPAGDDAYTSPTDNPFVDAEGRDEIFAYGLRNPFRFSFDRLTGDLAVGDVGQTRREEVDFLPARAATGAPRPGANFGWDCFEGSLPYNGGSSCLRGPSGHTEPVRQLLHSNGYCSIIGGFVARHASMGGLRGDYVYGDFCQDELHAVHLTAGGSSNERRIGVAVSNLVSFGEDGRGRLYAVSLNGPVYRLSS